MEISNPFLYDPKKQKQEELEPQPMYIELGLPFEEKKNEEKEDDERVIIIEIF